MPIFNLSALLHDLKMGQLQEFTASDFKKVSAVKSGHSLKLDAPLITMAALPHGRLACLTEKALQIMDIQTGECIKKFDSIQGGETHATNSGLDADIVLGLHVLLGGNQLLIRRSSGNVVIDLETGELMLNLSRYSLMITDGHKVFESFTTSFVRQGNEIIYPELMDYRYYADLHPLLDPLDEEEKGLEKEIKDCENEILKAKEDFKQWLNDTLKQTIHTAESYLKSLPGDIQELERRLRDWPVYNKEPDLSIANCLNERYFGTREAQKQEAMMKEKYYESLKKNEQEKKNTQSKLNGTRSYIGTYEKLIANLKVFKPKVENFFSAFDNNIASYQALLKEFLPYYQTSYCYYNYQGGSFRLENGGTPPCFIIIQNGTYKISQIKTKLEDLRQKKEVENAWFRNASSVEALELHFAPLTQTDIIPLLEAMKNNPHGVKTLSLSQINLNEEGVRHILALLESGLQLNSLNLEETGLTPEQAKVIKTLWHSKKRPAEGLLFSSSLMEGLRALSTCFNPDIHVLNNFLPVSPPPVLQLKEEPDGLRCFLTKQIMFKPVVASDGYTYEKEAITAYLETGKNSPHTRKLFSHNYSNTNKHVQKQIKTFLKEHPEARVALYLPQQFCDELQKVCNPITKTSLFSVLELDRRLLFMPVLDHKKLLLEVLCENPEGWALLPEVIARLEPSEIHAILRIKPLEDWLTLLAKSSLTYQNNKPALCFLGVLEKTFEQLIPPVTLALYALKRKDDALFQLAVSRINDVNQTVDDQDNTLLHLAAAQGRTHLVSFLLDQKANPKLLNLDGKTPKKLADENGYIETADAIAVVKITPLLNRLGLLEGMRQLQSLQQRIQQLEEREVGSLTPRSNANV